MFNPDKELVQTKGISMYPHQWATIEAYAKDGGYTSTAAGLRRIVDEWFDMKKAAHSHEAATNRYQNALLDLLAAVTQALAEHDDGDVARERLIAATGRAHLALARDPGPVLVRGFASIQDR